MKQEKDGRSKNWLTDVVFRQAWWKDKNSAADALFFFSQVCMLIDKSDLV